MEYDVHNQFFSHATWKLVWFIWSLVVACRGRTVLSAMAILSSVFQKKMALANIRNSLCYGFSLPFCALRLEWQLCD